MIVTEDKTVYQKGDWVVIDHYGDIWTAQIKEIKDGMVIWPDEDIHVEPKCYHVSRIRKATSGEIAVEEARRKSL